MKSKKLGLPAGEFVWAIVLGCLVSPFAEAAGVKNSIFNQDECQLRAHSQFIRKAIDVEMASITGKLSEPELVGQRIALHQRLEKENAHCRKMASNGRSLAELGASGQF